MTKAMAMYRSLWELEVQARYQREHLADELHRCASIDRFEAGPGRLPSRLRRRVGIGLIRLGAAIAGSDVRRGLFPPVFGAVSPATAPPGR